MPGNIRVFLSSTWVDLQPERHQVEETLRRMGTTDFIGMEYFGSREDTPKETCLSEVRKSQIYIGIYGFRYGTLDPATGISMTELEYLEAGCQRIPRLLYLKDDQVNREPHQIETDPVKQSKLETFKRGIGRNHTYSVFKDSNHLAAQVAADLHKHIFNFFLADPLKRAEDLLDARAYRMAEESLKEIIKQFPKNAQAHALSALALLAGRNPEQLGIERIRQIESSLELARADIHSDLFYVASIALAVVRHDFYEDTGQKVLGLRCKDIAKELKGRQPSARDLTLLKHIDATWEAKQILGITL